MIDKTYLLLGLGVGNIEVKKYFDLKKIKYSIYDDNIEEYRTNIDFNNFDILVKSSGIKDDHFIIRYAKLLKKLIITDLEMFYLYSKPKKLITVTGSNGKTTIVSLLKHLLNHLDLGGNIGVGLSSFIDSDNDIIIEASSFMLDYVDKFKSDISVFTNLTINHLDHHNSFKDYVKAKLKLIKNINKDSYVIYNYDDLLLRRLFRNLDCKLIKYSLKEKIDIYLEGKNIYYQGKLITSTKDYQLAGMHNLENLLAAISVIIAYDRKYLKNLSTLKTFKNIPNRLEYLGKYKQAKVYNDSKATNFYALKTALAAFNQEKILLICGGKLKQDNYKLIDNYLDNLSLVIINGENKSELAKYFEEKNVKYIVSEKLIDAINLLKLVYSDEAIILFSPGSSSYDQFKNYVARGNYFKTKMKELYELE